MTKVLRIASLVAVLTLLSVGTASAWTAPASAPPNGNTAPPINTSSSNQTKSGVINVSGGVNAPAPGGFQSLGNYGGTGSAAYFPNGLWSNAANAWIYGTIYTNGPLYAQGVGQIRDANGGWIRTYGDTGWYSQTYGGGWYMSDGTWLRAYGNKGVYTAGQIRGDAGFCIGGSCITAWPSSSDTLQTVTDRGAVTTNQITINNNNPTIFLQDTDHRTAMIHNNSNLLYVLRGCGNNTTAWCTAANGWWPFVINLEDNSISAGGVLSVATDVRAPLYYDSNDLSYYLDPASVSRLNDIRPNIMYDGQDTSYYVDPNATSRVNVFYRTYGFNGPEYDGNNASYYLDPNATSNVNAMYTATLCIAGVCKSSWPSTGLAAEADTLGTVVTRGNQANQISISRDGITPCCGEYTASLNEYTNGNGRLATLQFHNSGTAWANLKLDGNGLHTNTGLYADGGVNGSELYTRDNVWLGYMGGWMSSYLNQSVTSVSTPTFNNMYLGYIGDYLSNRLNQSVVTNSQPTFWNINLGYLGWLSNYLNQSVTVNSQPQFSRIYDDNTAYYMDLNNTTVANQINANTICLNGDCRTSWSHRGGTPGWYGTQGYLGTDSTAACQSTNDGALCPAGMVQTGTDMCITDAGWRLAVYCSNP